MSRTLPRIIALAPGGVRGAFVAIAASRAGVLGVLDLQGAAIGSAGEALDAVAATGEEIGLRVEAGWCDSSWLATLPTSVTTICCLADARQDWVDAVGRIARSGRKALVEVVDRDSASQAISAGASGVIVAGNEAGGWCSDESSFILLQAVLATGQLAVWVRGGIGPSTAAGCIAAGASGVVLDGALLLARESPLDETTREAVARLDGAETVVIRPRDGVPVRLYAPPGSSAFIKLKELDRAGSPPDSSDIYGLMGWEPGQALPIGQDAAFAAALARWFVTTGGITQAVETAIDRALELARKYQPLAPGSPLAQAHGTTFPIVQGPMTRVSDTAAFALAVAEDGGLPFLALAMLRGPEVRALLAEARDRLAGRSWGVGVLGFVTPELRREQVEAIREARPPFALIAGGRPDQARELEDVGIRTYLHVPSPELLGQYLKSGARRFVLEGRECGGHVGPRSSLVLWEQAVSALLGFIESNNSAEEIHVLFAGGIHDSRSSAAVSAISAPLAAKGVKIGVLIGTAYLFTEEAVTTGAVVSRFQAEAVRCRETVLLTTGPGHEIRVGPSPFVNAFAEARRRLISDGNSAEQVRIALEQMNAGRLRLAAKGLDRANGAASPVPEPEQYDRGAYMLGQVATLRGTVTTIAELHREISEGADDLLQSTPKVPFIDATPPTPSDIAIVGLSAILPGAENVRAFWENSLNGKNAIVEIPPDRWDWRTYYDADPKAPDKVISKWGGFVPDIAFDPLRYGMPPTSIPSIEPVQLLVLEAVRQAIDDAGYTDRPFPRERTAVVLGMGGGAAQLAMGYAFRSYLPMLESVAPEAGKAAREAASPFLPEWTEDSFPGFLLNVAAGRVANRFDLGGSNYTVDAACGSSLAAASLAVRELETGVADMVILGGADTVQNPLTYLAFSKTHAFSPRGRCRPFDVSADGIVISEGVGVVILKRLSDAERDGDRIYAVIKGMGSSSDGRARGLTAPNVDGQTRALTRAFEKSGVDPATIGYVEAHGTGTAVGDVVEVNALAGVLREAGAEPGSCAVGSVKSMIGHTKCAAGIAGLINASLALYHKVLPPTIGVDSLNPKADLSDGPLRVSTKRRPWFHGDADHPRRAGVSAFGFGGTNFHAVLERHDRSLTPPSAPLSEWPDEIFLWRAETPRGLIESFSKLEQCLHKGATPRLRDLARTLADRFDSSATTKPTLVIVASSLDDLKLKLSLASEAIRSGREEWSDPRGIEFAARPRFAGEPVAFLFPGQGSQSLEMLGDLAFAFTEVREVFEVFDNALVAEGRDAVTPRIFPPTTLDDAGRERARLSLMATEVAQPAVGAASVAMLRLLNSFGVTPDSVAGHSYGELVALHAAGCLPAESLAVLSEIRGSLMREAASKTPGAMAAIMAGPDQVRKLVETSNEVVIANFNGPKQTVISGPRDAVAKITEWARTQGLRTMDLPVSCAFHSDAVNAACLPLAERAYRAIRKSPQIPVYANLDASLHPADPEIIAERLGRHVSSPVRFSETIEAMYAEGTRIFVEVGPGAVLSSIVGAVLEGRSHLALATDQQGRSGLTTLLKTLARLIASGIRVRPARLFEGRETRRVDLERLSGDGTAPLPASTWLVNGSRARPLNAPERQRLGQVLDLKAPADSIRDHTAKLSRNGHNTSNGKSAQGAQVPMTSDSSSTNGASHNGHRDLHRDSPTNGTDRNGHSPLREANPVHHGRGRQQTSVSSTDSARVMEAFQQTMRTFLETQQSTMLAYLGREVAEPGREQGRAGAGIPANPERSQPVQAPTKADVPPPIAARSTSFPMPGDRLSPVLQHMDSPSPDRSSSNGSNGSRRADASLEVKNESTISPTIVNPSAVRTTRDSIAGRLIEIVRDRTGYPAEMLKLDLDLEADLGIDSIKRVEILGTLRESVEGLENASTSLMDGLSRARTLGEIVDKIATAIVPGRTPASGVLESEPAPTKSLIVESASSPIQRLSLNVVDAPLVGGSGGLMVGGVIVVTDDGRGVAQSLKKKLRSEGCEVEILSPDRVDLSSPAAVQSALEIVRGSRPIVGMVHALPLQNAPDAGLDARIWADRMRPEVNGLFLLARAAARDLEIASRNGGACLVAATAMGGAFAVSDCPSEFFPGHGAIAGLVKTLAREWPEVRARVVDLDVSDPSEKLASRLANEVLADDGWPEVGYRNGRRVRIQTVHAPLDRSAVPLSIAPGEPILITGGARGITAAVSLELARRWQPTFLLVGSSPAVEIPEDSSTAGVPGSAELKRALHERLRRERREVGPAELERAYRSLLHQRENRATIAAIRSAGSVVEYASADVRDSMALSRALDSWRGRFGDPVGLIHGAGVIHDKLLRDKTPESFDRVLSTKLDGALNLARLLRPEPLRFAALFSSIAGRFGNKGQSDYAAANEALNKLAIWLDRHWPGRVLSVNWGPWSGVGMVSDLEGHLGRRGLGMIPPDVGSALMADELAFGRKGDVEAVIAGELGSLDQPLRPIRDPAGALR